MIYRWAYLPKFRHAAGNTNFKVVEFNHVKLQAGLPSFVMSDSEWIEETSAIGITVKKEKYGGAFSHKDIDLNLVLSLVYCSKMI